MYTWKGTKNLCQNCTAMQNTERFEKWCEWLRHKGRSTNHCKVYTIWCMGSNSYQMLWCKNRPRVKDSKCKMLTRFLYKTAATFQHYDFVLLSKHIAIMWRSPADFPKLKMLRVLAYLFKYKFDFDKNWIFIAIYGFIKL